MTSFAALGVDPRLVDALDAAGITDPFPIQALTIPDAVTGRDVCGKAKTGSGKTLAFGLPLLAIAGQAEPNHPHAVVLVPTRELALQVTEVLAPLGDSVGCRVEAVYGGASMERQRIALARGADVLVATPGRLIDFIDNGAVRLDDVRVVVLDEADRMADMGFLPQVEWLLRRITSPHQTLLFSATLDGAVDHVVRRHLKDPVFHEVQSDMMTVEEMAHRFVLVHQLDKVKVAAAISRGAERSLIFVRTKRGADRLVEQLLKEGVSAAAIHGDLRQQMREKSLGQFTEGKLPVLVATDVAARASTSTTSTSSSTTTHLRTRRTTSIVRAARRGQGSPASSSRSCSGTKSSRCAGCSVASPSTCRSSRCSPTTFGWVTSRHGIRSPSPLQRQYAPSLDSAGTRHPHNLTGTFGRCP